ncbi:MAG: GumC family protein, partial [Candidatus Binatia bacterium]
MPEDSRELSPYRVLHDPQPNRHYPAPGGFAEEEVHLRDYWRVLRKHRRIAVSIFLAVVVTTAIVSFTMDPRYTATATLQIERHAPNIAPVVQVQQVDALAYDKYDYYQTQYEVLESRTIASRVIRALDLENDRRFTEEAESEGLLRTIAGAILSLLPGAGEDGVKPEELGVDPRLINRYLRMLEINPVRNSRLVDVSFTSKHRDLSAEIANKHVEEYTNAALEQRLGMTLKAKEFLERELAKAKDRVVSTEVALNAFRKDKGIVSLDGGKTDIVSERLADLNGRFTEAQSERIRLEGQYRLIQQRDYESLPDVVTSPFIAQLKQEVSKIEAERAELGRKFKPGYPKMREVIGREEQAKERLDAEIRKIVEGIESGYLAAKNREEELGKKLESQRHTALAQKDVGADY